MHKKVFPARPSYLVALGVSAALLTPTLLAGCGGQSQQNTPVAPPPPSSRMGGTMGQGTTRQGMSTGKKVALVAGAALLYYLYRRHQNAQTVAGSEANGKYYISESTKRVYYRYLSGPNKGKFQWVSPPQPMQVPQSAVQQYGLQNYQGYERSTTGTPFGGYGATNRAINPAYDEGTVPGTDLS